MTNDRGGVFSGMRRTGLRWVLFGLFLAALAGAVALGVWFPEKRLDAPTQARIQTDLDALKSATLQFAREERRLPQRLGELVPRYLPGLPVDPWGRAYVLKPGGSGRLYIWCLGADGLLQRYPPDICAIVDAP